MTIEEKLKEYILQRYKSIREFTLDVGMSYTTVDSILKRGIGNSSVTNIIKICKALNISADELSNGRITPVVPIIIETTDVAEIMENTKRRLLAYALTLNGEKVDRATINNIINAIDVGVEVATRKTKKSDDDSIH